MGLIRNPSCVRDSRFRTTNGEWDKGWSKGSKFDGKYKPHLAENYNSLRNWMAEFNPNPWSFWTAVQRIVSQKKRENSKRPEKTNLLVTSASSVFPLPEHCNQVVGPYWSATKSNLPSWGKDLPHLLLGNAIVSKWRQKQFRDLLRTLEEISVRTVLRTKHRIRL